MESIKICCIGAGYVGGERGDLPVALPDRPDRNPDLLLPRSHSMVTYAVALTFDVPSQAPRWP